MVTLSSIMRPGSIVRGGWSSRSWWLWGERNPAEDARNANYPYEVEEATCSVEDQDRDVEARGLQEAAGSHRRIGGW